MFLRRFLSTILLWVLLLAGISWNQPVVFFLVVGGVASIGLLEFYGLAARGGVPSFPRWGVFGGMVLIFGTWLLSVRGFPLRVSLDFEQLVIMTFVLGVFLRQLPQKHNPKALATMTCTVFGLFYVPWLLNFVTKINYLFGPDGRGHLLVFYLILVTKATDMGAYLLGSLFGRHPLIPRISPKKTWEGVIGGVLTATFASVLLWRLSAGRVQERLVLSFDWTDALLLGVLLGSAAVAGDLAESLLKRDVGAKDSGRIVPGIGGMLDLIDSLLFTAPLLYVYIRLFAQ